MISLTQEEFLQRLMNRYWMYRLCVIHLIGEGLIVPSKVTVDEKGNSHLDLTELANQLLLPALLAAVDIVYEESESYEK